MINDFGYIYGGAEKIFFDLRIILEESAHVDTFFGTTKRTNESKEIFINPIILIQLAAKLITNRYDVIFIHNIRHVISPFTFLICKIFMPNAKIVLYVHDYYFVCPKLGITYNGQACNWNTKFHESCVPSTEKYNGLIFQVVKIIRWYLYYYMVILFTDILIASSKSLYIKIRKKKKTVYLPTFTIINKPSRANIHAETTKKPSFIFVGRLSKEKGVDVILKAVQYLKVKNIINFRVLIIGNGPLYFNLKKDAKILDIGTVVKFLGYLPNKNILPYYKKAIATIVPSLVWDNLPTVIVESLSLKTPVIATKIGAIPDLVINKKNGMLFQRGNYLELAIIMEKFLSKKNSVNMSSSELITKENILYKQIYREKLYSMLTSIM